MTCKEVCRWYTTFVKLITMLQAVMKVLMYLPYAYSIDLITEQLAVRIVGFKVSTYKDVCSKHEEDILIHQIPCIKKGMVELNGMSIKETS